MQAKTIARLAPLLVLAACGGGSGDDAPPDLHGVWYAANPTDASKYDSPQLITQSGNEVTLTACNRSTTPLRLDGANLVYTDGTRFAVQPGADAAVMTGLGAPWRRFSQGSVFDSGRLSLSVPNQAAVQANQDVCALRFERRYKLDNGAEIHAAGVMITAPFGASHVEVQLAFQTLRAGDFAVRDRNGFVQDLDGSVHVQLHSPAYRTADSQDTLQISSGQLRVGITAGGAYTFVGQLTTSTGLQVPLSAEVTLERRL